MNHFRINHLGQVGIEERKHGRLVERQNNEKIETVDQLTFV